MVRSEGLWNVSNDFSDLSQFFCGNTCVFDFPHISKINNSVIVLDSPFVDIKLFMSALIVGLSKEILFGLPKTINCFLIDHSLFKEPVPVNMVDIGPFGNFLIHHRLSESWLILLIVAIPSIAYNIDKDVLEKGLPVLNSNFDHFTDILGLVSIYMDDGSLDSFCYISTVKSCPCFSWCCRETDLIVCHNMHCSIVCVVWKISHLQTFIDYSLTSKGCISMN